MVLALEPRVKPVDDDQGLFDARRLQGGLRKSGHRDRLRNGQFLARAFADQKVVGDGAQEIAVGEGVFQGQGAQRPPAHLNRPGNQSGDLALVKLDRCPRRFKTQPFMHRLVVILGFQRRLAVVASQAPVLSAEHFSGGALYCRRVLETWRRRGGRLNPPGRPKH